MRRISISFFVLHNLCESPRSARMEAGARSPQSRLPVVPTGARRVGVEPWLKARATDEHTEPGPVHQPCRSSRRSSRLRQCSRRSPSISSRPSKWGLTVMTPRPLCQRSQIAPQNGVLRGPGARDSHPRMRTAHRRGTPVWNPGRRRRRAPVARTVRAEATQFRRRVTDDQIAEARGVLAQFPLGTWGPPED